MPIPAFLTQIFLTSADTVAVIGGSGGTVALPTTSYYYLLSNKTSAGDGRSLLAALGAALSTADGTATYTCVLSSSFGLRITHNSGSSKSVVISQTLAEMLGWYLQGVGGSPTPVPTGANGATSTIPPLWFWTPNMVVTATGPELFDPTVNFGVPSSAGSAHVSPDMTASYVSNGIQYEAEFLFNGVEGYHKAFPAPNSDPLNVNRDFLTWWKYGPRLGRKILYWRDRSQLVATAAPSVGSAYPFRYIEYQPKEELRAAPTMSATVPNNPNFWDVRLPFWLTPRLDGVFS
jgi:hypothetical protein